MAKNKKIEVEGKEITILYDKDNEYIFVNRYAESKRW